MAPRLSPDHAECLQDGLLSGDRCQQQQTPAPEGNLCSSLVSPLPLLLKTGTGARSTQSFTLYSLLGCSLAAVPQASLHLCRRNTQEFWLQGTSRNKGLCLNHSASQMTGLGLRSRASSPFSSCRHCSSTHSVMWERCTWPGPPNRPRSSLHPSAGQGSLTSPSGDREAE